MQQVLYLLLRLSGWNDGDFVLILNLNCCFYFVGKVFDLNIKRVSECNKLNGVKEKWLKHVNENYC